MWSEIKKAMLGRHRLLFWNEKLTVSLNYSLIFRFFKIFTLPLVIWYFLLFHCFPSALHESHISLLWSTYQICDLQIFFTLHRLTFNFIDGFFYYAEGFEFDVFSLVYFWSSCLCFWWLTCLSCLYFGKQSFINYLFPIIFSDSYQKTQTGWMDTKIRPINMLSTRDPLQF